MDWLKINTNKRKYEKMPSSEQFIIHNPKYRFLQLCMKYTLKSHYIK